MVTCVQLDTSHVSRGVTVWREKVLRYIRNCNIILRYAFLEHFSTLRFTTHGSRSLDILSEFLVIPSLT